MIFFIFYSVSNRSFPLANSEDPAAFDLVLHCLPMSQVWNARLIWLSTSTHTVYYNAFHTVLL